MFKKLADQVLGDGWEEQLKGEFFPPPPERHAPRPPTQLSGDAEESRERSNQAQDTADASAAAEVASEQERAIQRERADPRRRRAASSARRDTAEERQWSGERERPQPAQARPRASTSSEPVRQSRHVLLGSNASLRQAIILKEVLDKPVSLRSMDQDMFRGL